MEGSFFMRHGDDDVPEVKALQRIVAQNQPDALSLQDEESDYYEHTSYAEYHGVHQSPIFLCLQPTIHRDKLLFEVCLVQLRPLAHKEACDEERPDYKQRKNCDAHN